MKEPGRNSLWYLLCAALLLVAATGDTRADKGRGKCVEIFMEINKVSAANLIKSLYLSSEQANKLITLARRAQKENIQFEGCIDRIYPAAMKNLRATEAELTSDGRLSERTSGELTKTEADLLRIVHPHEEKMKALSLEVRRLLTPNQFILLSEFKPCLRPPKETSNPERVGQLNNCSIFEKLLKRVRGLTDKQYRQKESSYVENAVRLRNKLHLECGNAEEEEGRIREIFRKTRAFSDSDFEIRRKDLGEKLADFHKARALSDEECLKRISEWLLEPSMIPLYEACAKEGLQ